MVLKIHANVHLKNHEDFLLGWGNPFVRKCNILFNLEDHPIYITHGKKDESKYIMPGQLMALNVQLSHGCDHKNVDIDSKMFSINLRKNYFDTVTYLILTIFLGIVMFTLGIIGEYVLRGVDESRQRPLYLIKETIGLDYKD